MFIEPTVGKIKIKRKGARTLRPFIILGIRIAKILTRESRLVQKTGEDVYKWSRKSIIQILLH